MTMKHPATVRKPNEGRRIGILGDVYRFLATGQETEANMPCGRRFPLLDVEPTDPIEGLLESLGVTFRFVGKSEFDVLVEVEPESVLHSLTPDFKQLATLPCRGLIATARSSDPQFDFVSQFFAPALGIDEDPVTSAAHCCLAPYWGKLLGKSQMVGYQASARGGIVHVEIREQRVILGGEAVILAAGEIAVG